MKVSIQDKEALAAVSPSALLAYARADGWTKEETYGEHSDVYSREEAPEIIIPRTQHLGDYASVVSRLIEIFADVAGTDVLSLYRILMTIDRDVVRVRAVTEGGDGTVSLSAGVKLITGARDLVLATARSLHEPRSAYRGAPYRETKNYLRQVQLGQTEQGSFVVTLIGPLVPSSDRRESELRAVADDPPVARRMTERLAEALIAVRKAVDDAFEGDNNEFSGGDYTTFPDVVNHGVSANLCDALAMMIEPFCGIDVALSWARTRPSRKAGERIHFTTSDAPILHEAARRFRGHGPDQKPAIPGHIRRLRRDGPEALGNVTLVDSGGRSIQAVLNPRDYKRAVRAHGNDARVVMDGDLDGSGSKWRLRNPRIVKIIFDEDDASGDRER